MKERELSLLKASLTELEGDNFYGENFPQMTLEEWSRIDVKSFVRKRKVTARAVLHHAVKVGLVKKRPCTVCGEQKSEAHHHDYTRSLDVIWLCKKHHSRLHREANSIKQKRLQYYTFHAY